MGTVSTAIPSSAVARATGIKTIFQDLRAGNVQFLSQRIALVGQGASVASYALTKLQVTSAKQVGETYGFGSPLHLAAKELFPANGDGVGTIPVTVYPLVDDGSGVASAGDITPAGAGTLTASYVVIVNGIESLPFLINAGDNVATITAAMTTAINGNIDMPVIAADGTTEVDLTSKWEGLSANDLTVTVVSSTADVIFVITQPVGGLVNPDIDAALALFGDVWETMVINCLDIADTATLDKYSTFGEGRWGALVKKPLMVFTGNNEADVTTAVVVSNARPTDRVNSQCPAPGSVNLPFLIAARKVARMALRADGNPPHDFASLDLDTITPGTDGEQWDYTERDLAVKAGSSTVVVKDGVLNIADTIMFYKPVGEPIPAFRYAVDIVKLQQIIYNLDLIFNSPEWDGAPLIPDNQATINATAKQPKMAKAAIAQLADVLALNAIISDADFTKSGAIVEIDAQNPKRLNICMPVQLSGNANIISIDLKFGFFFGTSATV